jgi:hypothetical protein
MDFIKGFLKVGGKSVVLTIVDRFSKIAHFITLGHPYSALSVAKAFFEGVVQQRGFPYSIVSDRDSVFTSSFWMELFKLAGFKLQMSSPFHPQSYGQSEVVNHVITMYLCCLAGDRLKSWLRWLPWAEYCYNTSFQSTLKCSPFQVVYGREPPTFMSYSSWTAKVAAVDKQLQERDEFLAEIKDMLVQAQVTMKQYQDKSWHEVVFQVGDWVWLRLQQRSAVGVTPAANSKLGPNFFGPYQVTARIGQASYRLKTPNQACIHDVYHVFLLKKFEGATPSEVPQLLQLLHEKVIPSPERVIRAHLNRGVWELLVKWQGWSKTDTT